MIPLLIFVFLFLLLPIILVLWLRKTMKKRKTLEAMGLPYLKPPGIIAYTVAAIGLIPFLGIPFAIISCMIGIEKYRNNGKGLLFLGSLGIVQTVIMECAMLLLFKHSVYLVITITGHLIGIGGFTSLSFIFALIAILLIIGGILRYNRDGKLLIVIGCLEITLAVISVICFPKLFPLITHYDNSFGTNIEIHSTP